MASITTRAGKGTPLTNTEVDANFTNLNAEVTPARPTIRPSLLLDFANSKAVDSRITFTRSTTATYYDAQGVLRYAQPDQPRIDHDPVTGECKGLLIEEQRTNLILYSQTYTGWTSSYTDLYANSCVAPDGTKTGATFTVNTETLASGCMPASFTADGTSTYTGSIYLRKEADNDLNCICWFRAGLSSGLQYSTVTVNLITGFVSYSAGSSTVSGYSVEDVGGWWRVTFVAGGIPAGAMRIGVRLNYAPVGTHFSVWGAQVEAGAFATSYIPTAPTFTSRASSATYFDSTGVLRTAGVNQARYGYGYDSASGKWVSQGLVLESAATNLFLYGSDLASGFTVSQTSEQANSYTAPDGTTSATKVTPLGATLVLNRYTQTTASTVTSGAVYTASFYAKANGVRYIAFDDLNQGLRGAAFDLVTGQNNAGSQALSSSMTDIGGGWWRCSVTFATASTSLSMNFELRGTYGNSYEYFTFNGTDSVYLWGAQLESGYVATSYIPTYGATATRAADVSSSAATTRVHDVTKLYNFGNTYSKYGWSMYVEAASYTIGINNIIAELNSTSYTTTDRTFLASGSRLWSRTTSGGQDVGLPIGDMTAGVFAKTAVGFAKNDVYVSRGQNTFADTTALVPQTIDYLSFGFAYDNVDSNCLNGYIKRFAYYPKRLSNTELQALTA